ncbi:MAG: beta-ketoacyl-ACP synthase I [Candidatus Omnitrophica bacterium]|nr:beta-ketoacyl-ACP synthase I [Candidatus Omnitrophota bacterium]
MRRVVITGMGIVSCLGNSKEAVTQSLKEGKSGIRFEEEYNKMGLRSQVAGWPDIDLDALVDRKLKRFMGDAAAYAYVAMQQAIEDSRLSEEEVTSPSAGVVAGSGGASSENVVWAADTLREKGIRRLGPYVVPRTMSSTVAACLSTSFKTKGVGFSLSSACATSAHCIGVGMEQIQLGKQEIVFAGGAEEEHWTLAMMFDSMGALSTKYNDTPERASRPFDADRDGFIIAGGAGILVLEERERAIRRGAKIYAELVGYGATSDGSDMVQPSGEGAIRCMRQAIATVKGPIDYINAHGTSTPVGDMKEIEALREVFGAEVPPVSSTKSLNGHSLGAAGVHEAIHSLLMMEENFISGTANVENLDPRAEGVPIVTQRRDNVKLTRVLSNSFGFGGTNASLVFERPSE